MGMLRALGRRLAAVESWLHARLSRVRDRGAYVPELDGVRFFATLLVVGNHVVKGYMAAARRHEVVLPDGPSPGRFATEILGNGNGAIPLYFALSGMIIAWPFVQARVGGAPPVTLGRYWLRRLTRIEPPYLIALAIHVVVLLAIGVLPFGWSLLGHLAASAAYLHFIAFGRPSTIMDVAWSLEVEIQFYVAAPVLAWLFFAPATPRARRIGLAVAIFAAAAVHASFPVEYAERVWRNMLPGQLEFFLAGFLLAEVFATQAPRTGRLRGDVLAMVGWGLVLLVPHNLLTRFVGMGGQTPPPLHHAALVLGILAIIAGTLTGRVWRATCRLRWIATLGGMCYTYYLYHGLLLLPLNGWLMSRPWVANPWANILVVAALGVLAISPACIVLFAVFERPFMRRHGPWGMWRGLYERTETPPAGASR